MTGLYSERAGLREAGCYPRWGNGVCPAWLRWDSGVVTVLGACAAALRSENALRNAMSFKGRGARVNLKE